MSKRSHKKGFLHVYTGNGKGKTTASLGLAMRSKGRNQKVAVIFFDKGGLNYGERESLIKLDIPFFATGLDRIDTNGKFRFRVTEEDRLEGQKGITIFQQLLQENYELIILDEINSSLHLKLVDQNMFYTTLEDWNNCCELVCTGRNAPKKLVEMADLVTEMTLKKHYFYDNVKAREGIEF